MWCPCADSVTISTYPASPSWHRHARRARHRARRSLSWPSALSARSLGRAVTVLSEHHGSTASHLALTAISARQMPGQWWRCRVCNQHTPRACRFCGSCGAPMQDLTRPPSSPSTPIYSGDSVVGTPWHAKPRQKHYPSGGKGKGKGKACSSQDSSAYMGGRWRNPPAVKKAVANQRWARRSAKKETPVPFSGPLTGEHSQITEIKEQMQTLNGIVRGLEGKEDSMAAMMRTSAQEQLKSLRHQLT